MACIFCSNQCVKNYTLCGCYPAKLFTRATRKAPRKHLFREQFLRQCEKCKSCMTAQDITGLARKDGKLADVFKCWSCGHQEVHLKAKIKEQYL